MSRRRDRGLLLSIRPQFADAIIQGRKTIELRRTRPRIPPGTYALLYASAPRMAVVAIARISSIVEDEPANIWRDYEGEIGISAAGFRDYFDGAETAYGLQLRDITPLDPLSLSDLRALGVEPPQSWRYLDHLLVDQISSGIAPSPTEEDLASRSGVVSSFR